MNLIETAKGLLKAQGDKCAECGEPLKYEDATKRSHSFDIICQPCYAKPRADVIVIDDLEWQPIDTAPTTGRQRIWLWRKGVAPQEAFADTWWVGGFSAGIKPTHWKPR